MKAILILYLCLPIAAIGQADSINIRQVFEKSLKAMDLRCNSLEFSLQKKSYDIWKSTEYVTCKMLFDKNMNMQKAWMSSKEFTNNVNAKQPENEMIKFLDKKADTAFAWKEDLKLLKVSDFNQGMQEHSYFFKAQGNYFRTASGLIKYVSMVSRARLYPQLGDTIIYFDKSNDTYHIDSALIYSGLGKVNNRVCYVIEHITTYSNNIYMPDYLYPSLQAGTYRAVSRHFCMYIDTANYIMRKYVHFQKTPKGDTMTYSSDELRNYKINTIVDIHFDAKNYPAKKILWQDHDTTKIYQDFTNRVPNIIGIDTSGKAFSLYQQKAKCYVLDFSYAACPVCIVRALPFWKSMMTKYNHPNIQYLIIDPVDNLDVIKKMIQTHEINIPVIQDKNATKNYAIHTYPACYILDENFNVLFKGFDLGDNQKVEVEKILSSYHNKTAKQK